MADEKAIAIAEEPQQITPVRRSILTISQQGVERIKLLSEMMAVSQLEYGKMKSSDIFIKMMKGIEIGLEPVASMDLIDNIKGKPTLKPQGMLALAWGSGLMQSLSITDDGNTCTVKMQRVGSPPHTETFSDLDARNMALAGKDNWKKQPATMRKWRAVSAACRIVFPDIIQGMYIPEEISPDTIVNEGGEIVEAEYQDVAKSNGNQQPEQTTEVKWPSKDTVKWVMDKFRKLEMSDTEILKLAGVTSFEDGNGWRKYTDPQAAVTHIQAAFDAELTNTKFGKADNGDRPAIYTCAFTYMAYEVAAKTCLKFANCNPVEHANDPDMIIINAYGRSDTVKGWLGDFAYGELKLNRYDKTEKTTKFVKMPIEIEFKYIDILDENGKLEYRKAVGITGEDEGF